MKHIFFTLLFFVGLLSFSQNKNDSGDNRDQDTTTVSTKKHEISLDVGAAVIPGIHGLNPRYEFIFNKRSSFGVDLNWTLDKDDDLEWEDYEKFSISPFYRYYFSNKPSTFGSGFYGEGFVKAYLFEDFRFIRQPNRVTFLNSDTDYFEMAVGVGAGWKWIFKSGLLIDLNIGVGRNLELSEISELRSRYEYTARGGLNIGWRF